MSFEDRLRRFSDRVTDPVAKPIMARFQRRFLEPGWYMNKEQPGMHRYWDGNKWTDQFRPILKPSKPELPPPPPRSPAPAARSTAEADELKPGCWILFLVVVVVTAIFIVYGLGRLGAASGVPSNGDDRSLPSQRPAALGTTIDTGTLVYKIHDVVIDYVPPDESQRPSGGHILVVVDIEVTNVSRDDRTVPPHVDVAFDAEGNWYEPRLLSARRRTPFGGVLEVSETQRGDLTFEVPRGTELRLLIIGDSPLDQTPEVFALTR